ncbi:hypothetical protein HL653_23385 [Sphingomonas sp. AP4-R1]|uniref:DUF6961 family protein n=1 Tax=Sphingomonas sp. AP4-R1 TaxID=2735134 RepID=UPI001493BCD8|nr:hypothetical protein [Sphingomonas sp. AP4-R1]QJU60287.1 hypothetical protein HL653_23385 [Sphingomonas sp. AP4-R1]
MTRDRELWARAAALLRRHGEEAPKVVAERVGALALEGDEEEIAVWLAIATRMDQLRGDPDVDLQH